MDLNEKIDARRRALALEAEKSKLAEITRQKEVDLEAEKIKMAEKAALETAVAKRFAENGIKHNPEEESPSIPQVSESDVDAEYEKALSKAASARMTGGESAMFFILLLMGLGGFFIKWWVGLAFVIWSVLYLNKKHDFHKEAILKEGRDNLEISQAVK